MRRRARGAALIAAVLVAALVAALAVALTARDRYAILAATRAAEQARADALLREIEIEAAALLGRDLEESGYDALDEAWARTTLRARRGAWEAVGELRDAQRSFNLNALAFQPPPAADDFVATPEPTPTADGVAGDPAAQALRALLADAGTSAPPAADGATPHPPPLAPQQIASARFALLLQALRLPAEILPALLDWLDPDSETRFPNGAEDEYYTRLDPPYRAANGPLAARSELRLVRGITPEIYAKLAPYVCVLGNSVPVNVNTAPAEVLMSLGPGIDRPSADLLIAAREIQPWPSVDAFLQHPLLAGRALLAPGLTTRSRWFELRVRVTNGDDTWWRRALIERLAPDRLRVVRRERLYVDD